MPFEPVQLDVVLDVAVVDLARLPVVQQIDGRRQRQPQSLARRRPGDFGGCDARRHAGGRSGWDLHHKE